MSNIPKHIAIIMDGNGRWARARNLPKIIGHRQGVESAKKVVKACPALGVKYLTLYTFSNENWNRPLEEVKGIFGLLEDFLDRELELFEKNNVRLNIIGQRSRIEEKLRKKIEDFERKTLNCTALTLNIALSYGARQEIIDAVKDICMDVKENRIDLNDINEEIFSGRLYTKGQPDPDLLIRTSGEMRISNFLLWQLSYAEIYVTKKYWPDFGEDDLKEAISDYQKRERRFGR